MYHELRKRGTGVVVQNFALLSPQSPNELLNRHTRSIELPVSWESEVLPEGAANKANFGFGTPAERWSWPSEDMSSLRCCCCRRRKSQLLWRWRRPSAS